MQECLPLPLVGVTADRQRQAAHWQHVAGEKYLQAVCDAAAAIPLVIPALPGRLDPDCLLQRLDGLLITGAYSNIEPHHYGEAPVPGDDLRDPERDAFNLRLIPLAIERGVPVLGICRGLQELNVALGGSLYQRVHETPGLDDHREDLSLDLDGQYGPAHRILIEPGGLLARVTGSEEERVNSVHGQGIRQLAPGLLVEARAPDGLVEAASVAGASAFALAVQWHPEWRCQDNPFYAAILRAFGQACRQRAQRRLRSYSEVAP